MNVFHSRRTVGGSAVQIGERDGLLGYYDSTAGRWLCTLSPRDLAFELESIGEANLEPAGRGWLLQHRASEAPRKPVSIAPETPRISCRRKVRRKPGVPV